MTLSILTAFAIGQGQDVPAADPKNKSDEVKKKLEIFIKMKKAAKSEEELVAAIQLLGETKDPKILKELGSYLKTGSDPVKSAVLGILVQSYKGEKAAAEEVISGLSAEVARAKRVKQGTVSVDQGHETAVAYFEALKALECKGIITKLAVYFRHANLEVARGAIRCAVALHNVEAVDLMISYMQELETKMGKGDKQTEEQKEIGNRKFYLDPDIQLLLQQISGQDGMRKPSEWAMWWGRNKAKFKAEEDKQK